MSASVPTAKTITSAFSSFTASLTFSTYAFPVTAESSSTLQTYKTGFAVINCKDCTNSCSFSLKDKALTEIPFNKVSSTFSKTTNSACASLLPVFAVLFTRSNLFSTVSKSFNCNSISIVSLSLTGSTDSST